MTYCRRIKAASSSLRSTPVPVSASSRSFTSVGLSFGREGGPMLPACVAIVDAGLLSGGALFGGAMLWGAWFGGTLFIVL